MTRKVNWGVLSTARIGIDHVIPAMQRGELSTVGAIASRDAGKAQVVATQLGIPQAHGSYEELLADPAIEAIYNPLPNDLHLPWTLRALESGKHVLCEKPVGLDAAEAQQLVEASARTGCLVAEAFMVRHHPQWLKARALIAEGRIGEARAIQTMFSFHLTDPADIRNKVEMGGGGLYDIGCYAINTARYVFGGEPERVIGMFDNDPVMGIDRMMSGLAEFADRRHLVFTCSTQLVPTQRLRIMGTKGSIAFEIPFNPVADAVTRIVVNDGRDLTGGGREIIELPASNQYTLQGDAFSRAIRSGEPLEWGIGDAVLNMRVIDAFFRSARTEGWEKP